MKNIVEHRKDHILDKIKGWRGWYWDSMNGFLSVRDWLQEAKNNDFEFKASVVDGKELKRLTCPITGAYAVLNKTEEELFNKLERTRCGCGNDLRQGYGLGVCEECL